ncbi:hypothetical protein R1flu_013118 [Riccia fluitans]|uniref:Uncharacterized protein n=1 Tax=Riccia fluitans TaxID=41844 RepID=A0ABD1ZCJ0_9MARC
MSEHSDEGNNEMTTAKPSWSSRRVGTAGNRNGQKPREPVRHGLGDPNLPCVRVETKQNDENGRFGGRSWNEAQINQDWIQRTRSKLEVDS